MKLIYIIFCIVAISLFQNCEKLERTNPLDPKNPESENDRFVLIENFTNISAGWPVESASINLEKLKGSIFKNNFIILEHHIEKTPGTDPDALDESYKRYLDLSPSIDEQGLPDVFFDGKTDRIQGASNDNAAYNRYKAALDKRVLERACFLIEPGLSIVLNELKIDAKIARLGKDDIHDVVVKMIIAEQKNNRLYVRHISAIRAVSIFKAGTIIEISKSVEKRGDWDSTKLEAIVFLEDKISRHVLQTAVVEN